MGGSDRKFDMERASPDRLITGFSRSRILYGLFLALAVHVGVIGSTSMQYIMDTWIDPEAAIARKQQEEDAKKAQAEAVRKANEAKLKKLAEEREKEEAARGGGAKPPEGGGAPPGPTAPEKSGAGASGSSGASGGEEVIPEDRKNTPMVKKITETAKPGDIPKTPDMDLPFSATDPDEK
jgi:hypothetical protein